MDVRAPANEAACQERIRGAFAIEGDSPHLQSPAVFSKMKLTRKIFILIILLFISHFLFGQSLELPFCDSTEITDHYWYKLKYNEKTEQADWAAYELTRDELTGTAPRRDSFRADPAISSGSAGLEDYRGSGYDRGHLVPAGDLKVSADSMRSSFLLSNICPQRPELNRGIWLDLENYVRTWAWEYGSVYITAGPVFKSGNYDTIGENNVAIPDYFFKTVLVYNDTIQQAAAFIIPNSATENPVEFYMISIDDAENITGFDFFHLLPDYVEHEIEASVNPEDWIWEEFSFLNKSNEQNDPAYFYKYWINSASGTRHNPSCEYYGNTEEGYYTNKKTGKACGICGG